MKSYQGLGFAFEGEDEGLDRQLNQTIRGFRSINDLIPTMGKSFQKTEASTSSFKDSLAGMKTGFSAFTQGGTLTTSLEGQIVSMDKELRRMGRNAGYTGKELSKFKSGAMGMAMSLKISEEAAAEAQIGWTKAQAELEAVGIKSRQELAKFANVSGMSAKDLVTSLKTLRKEFQMTDSGLSRVVGAFQQLGQSTGSVDTAMQDMPKVLDLIRKRARGLGKDLPEDQLAGFAEQTANLASVMYKLTGDSTKAREAAFAIGQTMVDGRQQFLDMFAGLQNTMPDAMSAVSKSFGDVGVSMDMLTQGPSEFIAAMSQAVVNAKKQGKDISQPLSFIEGQLSKTFGPEQAQMMSAIFRNATQAEVDQLKVTKKGTAELGKYAKEGFTAGWTLSESFERSKEMLEMSFRSIGRSAAVDMVKESQKAFKTFGNELKTLAAKGGPMGEVITKMSEMSSIGGIALVPKALRPMAALTGQITEKMAPMIDTMGQAAQVISPGLTGAFGALKGLLSIKGVLLTGLIAFGGYLFTLSEAGQKVAPILEKVGDVGYKLLDGFAGMVEKIPEVIDTVDSLLASFFDSLNAKATSGETDNRWSKLVKRLGEGLVKAFKAASGIMIKIGLGFWDGLTGQLSPDTNKSGFARVGEAMGSAIRAATTWVIEVGAPAAWTMLKDVVKGFWGGLTGSIDPAEDATGAGRLGEAMGSAMNYALNWLKDVGIPQAWKTIKEVVVGFVDGLVGLTDPSKDDTEATRFGRAAGDMVVAGLKIAVPAIVTGALGLAGELVTSLITGVGQGVGRLASAIDEMVGTALGIYHEATEEEIAMYGRLAKAQEEGRYGMQLLTEEFKPLTDAMDSMQVKAAETFPGIASAMDNAEASVSNFGASIFGLQPAVEEASGSFEEWYLPEAEVDINRVADSMVNLGADVTAYAKGGMQAAMSIFKQQEALKSLDVSLVSSAFNMQKLSELGGALWSKMPELAEAAQSKFSSLAEKNLGLFKLLAAGKPPEAAAPELKLAKFDKKEYSGYRDMISKETEKVAAHLGEPTKKLVEEVLIAAFQNAYKKVDTDTRAFAKTETEVLGKMAKDVTSALGDMWKKILEQTEIATKAVSEDISYIASSLKTVESAFTSLNLARAAATDATATAEPDLSAREFKATTYEGQLLEAVRWPDWYDDYKKIFTEQITQLVLAVKSMGVTATPAAVRETAATKALKKPLPGTQSPLGPKGK